MVSSAVSDVAPKIGGTQHKGRGEIVNPGGISSEVLWMR